GCDLGLDQAPDECVERLGARRGKPHPGRQQQLAAVEEGRRVLELGDRHPTDRTVVAVRAGDPAQVQAGHRDDAAHAGGPGRTPGTTGCGQLYGSAYGSGRVGPRDRTPATPPLRTLATGPAHRHESEHQMTELTGGPSLPQERRVVTEIPG